MRVSLIALFFLLLPAQAEALPFGGLQEPPPELPARATLHKGKAIPPRGAPLRVQRVIAAANRIRRKPYIWGGGHGAHSPGSWPVEKGYDCSGAVSFALARGGFLSSPRVSGDFLDWGKRGRGRWITVWANDEHVYMIVAGLRWDTSGGKGPRWHQDSRSSRGFGARSPRGF